MADHMFIGNMLGDISLLNRNRIEDYNFYALQADPGYVRLKEHDALFDCSNSNVWMVTEEENAYVFNYVCANMATIKEMKGLELDDLFFEPKKMDIHEYFKEDLKKIILNNIGRMDTRSIHVRWITECVIEDEDGKVTNAVSRHHLIDSFKEV